MPPKIEEEHSLLPIKKLTHFTHSLWMFSQAARIRQDGLLQRHDSDPYHAGEDSVSQMVSSVFFRRPRHVYVRYVLKTDSHISLEWLMIVYKYIWRWYLLFLVMYNTRVVGSSYISTMQCRAGQLYMRIATATRYTFLV
jgi:hypothetical protein